MKKFLVELVQEGVKGFVVSSLATVPMFMALPICGYLYQNVIEPKLDDKFKPKSKAI